MIEIFILLSLILCFSIILILLQQIKKLLITNFLISFFLINITFCVTSFFYLKINLDTFCIIFISLVLFQSITLLILQGVRSSIQIRLLRYIYKNKRLSEEGVNKLDKKIYSDRIISLKKNNIIKNINNRFIIKNKKILFIYYFFFILKKLYNTKF